LDNKHLIFLHLLEERLLLLGNTSQALNSTELLPVPPLLNTSWCLCGCWFGFWISTDCFMSFFVHLFNLASGDAVLQESRELPLVSILVILLQVGHIVRNMLAEDVITVNLSVELFAFSIIAWESTVAVRNVNATISSTFQSSKHTGTSTSTGQSHIQVSTECTRSIINILYIKLLTIRCNLSFISLVQTKLLEEPSCQEKSCAISCSVVGQTNLNAISW